jgi:hypothetical protein
MAHYLQRKPGRRGWFAENVNRRAARIVNNQTTGGEQMKKLSYMLAVAGVATGLLANVGNVAAQERSDRDRGRGGWDPEQMRQRMMERVKEQLEITNEVEWKAVEPLAAKVMDARRENMTAGIRGFMGRGPGGGPPGGDRGGDRGRGILDAASPEAQALEKAIESKASNNELKAAMTKYRDSRKAKENALKQAQENLRKVLSVRQEAIAVANGWLD